MNRDAIENMIYEAMHAERQKDEETEKALAAAIAEGEQALIEALGDLWDELRPYIDKKWSVTNDGRVSLRFYVTADELELAPFVIVRDTSSNIYFATHVDAHDRWRLENVPGFLLQQRAAFADYWKRKIKELTEPLINEIYHNRTLSIDAAQRIVDQLTAIDPSQETYWQKLHEFWTKQHENRLRDKQQQELAEKERRLAAEHFRKEFEAYWAKRQQADESNTKILAGLQEKLDQETYQVWELTYSEASRDEYDEPVVHETWCFVLDCEPDEFDRWPVIDRRGAITWTRFFYPIKLTGPQTVKPSEHTATAGWVAPAPFDRLVQLFYSPDSDNIDALLDSVAWTEPPEQPEWPEMLTHREIQRIKNEIMHPNGDVPEEFDW